MPYRYDIHAENRVFREIFESNPHPLWVFDIETLKFLAVNDAAVAKYGYSREAFLSMTVLEIRPEGERDRLLAHLARQSGDIDRAGRWLHRTRSGTLLHVDITAHKLLFAGRKAEMVLAIDVTEQVRATEALEAAERKYRVLVEQSLVGIYIIKDGRLSYANPHLAEMFGYTPEQMVGMDLLEFIADSDRDVATALVRERLQGAPAGHETLKGRCKDGREIVIEIHGARVDSREGPTLIGVVVEITETARAEERNRAYVAQLERMLTDTIATISKIGETRDAYTAGHESRVARLATAIGGEMGFGPESLGPITTAALVHDTGKIGIPTDILAKPVRLSPQEYELVKTHVQLGYDILKQIEFEGPVAEAVLQHHERLDGSGYPNARRGDSLLMEARILAVADVVESMASHRPYRPSLGIDKALGEVESNRDRLFDADVVDACVRLFRAKGFAFN